MKQKKSFADFYAHHSEVQQRVAALNGFGLEHGLVQMQNRNQLASRVNFKDQWASHPTNDERQAYLQPFGLEASVDHAPAWQLFTDAPVWKKQLTETIYADVPANEKQGPLEEEGFQKLLDDQLNHIVFPELFGEYYDAREIQVFDAEATAATPYTIQPMAEWFGEEQKEMPKKLRLLQQDIAVLDGIAKKNIETSSFDFDGVKYHRNRAVEIMAQLEGEKENLQKSIDTLDQKLFRHACALAPLKEAEELKTRYLNYFDTRKEAEAFLNLANKIMNVLAPVFAGQTLQTQDIHHRISELKEQHEPAFKKTLKEWMERGVFATEPELIKKMENYLPSDWVYFYNDSFIDVEMMDLHFIVQESWACVNNSVFSLFKHITVKQAEYMAVKTEGVSV